MLDPQRIIQSVRRAAELFWATPGRHGSIVELTAAKDVLVLGDLHGHVHVLARVLKIADLDRNKQRHLVLQEVVHDTRINPDSDLDRSHRLVDLVAALKCQYPDRVHMLLGNHELSELTGRSIGKKGVFLNALFRDGVVANYGLMTDTVIEAYKELFAALPLAIRTPNRVFLSHTIPHGRDLDAFDPEVLRSRAWTREAMARGGTVYTMTWGRDTTPETADRFAALVDADWFINGHQPCEQGHRVGNHRQLIIDGTDPIPTYCLFHADGPITFESLLEGVRPVFG